jgi:hypothetical protein
MLRALATCALLSVALPGSAAAEWHFTPAIGVTFAKGSNLFIDFGDVAMERNNRTFGFTVSRLGEGIFGVEGIAAWTPSFFEGQPVTDRDPAGSNRALTMMGNVVLTTPRLWTEYSLRPFVSGGSG